MDLPHSISKQKQNYNDIIISVSLSKCLVVTTQMPPHYLWQYIYYYDDLVLGYSYTIAKL